MKDKKVKVIDNTFGQRLKGIRKSLKLTQADFANKMNISVTNLSDIENGKTHPCHDFFYRILKEFKVNLNYCLSGEGSMFIDMERESSAPPGDETDKNRYYYDVDHEDVREFLDYFFSSKIVRYHLMSAFTRLLNEEEEAIEKDRVHLEKAKTRKKADEQHENKKRGE
ncbi:MAG: helix-turn-helix domain-containing protein [Candidatus Aminicenantes bacterium]|nr:helix-turn-helix domain-containing protein [Candidatus Aminicenantes bacterium]NIM80595.1 helix-turn-helix domain-containing protein [Candidatus Aminicenantes bacterium]NIN19976.1 helix-turn-helix domain-containing protein [Candidatus Aminicenantes bacterium]NIN42604.1 helix-turn-helix domain-containing protein [Candidatus Aminicenantes bacterium]NIN86602.1 helix-turn-helix domain-containing protein [Candidatus Aminicenantes bacterium]